MKELLGFAQSFAVSWDETVICRWRVNSFEPKAGCNHSAFYFSAKRGCDVSVEEAPLMEL